MAYKHKFSVHNLCSAFDFTIKSSIIFCKKHYYQNHSYYRRTSKLHIQCSCSTQSHLPVVMQSLAFEANNISVLVFIVMLLEFTFCYLYNLHIYVVFVFHQYCIFSLFLFVNLSVLGTQNLPLENELTISYANILYQRCIKGIICFCFLFFSNFLCQF